LRVRLCVERYKKREKTTAETESGRFEHLGVLEPFRRSRFYEWEKKERQSAPMDVQCAVFHGLCAQTSPSCPEPADHKIAHAYQFGAGSWPQRKRRTSGHGEGVFPSLGCFLFDSERRHQVNDYFAIRQQNTTHASTRGSINSRQQGVGVGKYCRYGQNRGNRQLNSPKERCTSRIAVGLCCPSRVKRNVPIDSSPAVFP